MWRPILVLALAAGVADAKPKQPAKKHPTAAAHAAKTKQRPMGDNMPRGWSWPPSHEMLADSKVCEGKLDQLHVTWQPTTSEGHVVDAVTIPEMKLGGVAYVGIYGKGPWKMDCHLALSLETIGHELYGLGVREVHFGSIYRWSKVRVGGKTKNVLSRHALGLAMDVVSFVDADGREAVVGKDYKKGDELLLAIEKAVNDSGTFRLVLTPKNDPISHKDHFHIEANPDYSLFNVEPTFEHVTRSGGPASRPAPR
jgi:hypothetical protein